MPFNPITRSKPSHEFQIRLSEKGQPNGSMVVGREILDSSILVTGPNGYSENATVVNKALSGSPIWRQQGQTLMLTLSIPGPFSPATDGEYEVEFVPPGDGQPSNIRDINLNYVSGKLIPTIKCAIAPTIEPIGDYPTVYAGSNVIVKAKFRLHSEASKIDVSEIQPNSLTLGGRFMGGYTLSPTTDAQDVTLEAYWEIPTVVQGSPLNFAVAVDGIKDIEGDAIPVQNVGPPINPVAAIINAYYVSNDDGSGSGTGASPADPLTLAQLNTLMYADKLEAESTVLFKSGESFDQTFLMWVAPDTTKGDISVRFTSYGTGRATINFTTNGGGFYFQNRNGAVDNLNITCPSSDEGAGANHAIYFYAETNGANRTFDIRDCNITGFYRGAVIGTANFQNIEWTGEIVDLYCTGQGNESITSFTYDAPGNDAKGIKVKVLRCYAEPLQGNAILMGGCHESLIEGCHANGINTSLTAAQKDNLIWFWRANDCVIRNCLAENARGDIGETDIGGFGIDIQCERCIIERCTSVNTYGAGILIMSGPDHIVRNNLIINPAQQDTAGLEPGIQLYGGVQDGILQPAITNCKIYNNTFILWDNIAVGAQGIAAFNDRSEGLVANNLFVVNGNYKAVELPDGNGKNKIEFYQNLYYRTNGQAWFDTSDGEVLGIENFRGGNHEILNGENTGIEADPLFFNAGGQTAADYFLTANSPALSAGLDLLALGLIPAWGDDLAGNPISGTPHLGCSQTIVRQAYTQPWLPSSESTLKLWLDASDESTITRDGASNVSEWRDKGPLSVALAGQPGTDAITHANGEISIGEDSRFFNGATRLGLAANPAMTVVAVIETSDTSNAILFGVGATTGHSLNFSASSNEYSWRHYGGSKVFAGTNSTALKQVSAWRSSGDTYEDQKMSLDGTELAKSAGGGAGVPSATTTTVIVGFNGSAGWSGKIKGLLCFESDNDALRQRAEGYMAHLYGTADKLPANHPYKNSAPTL